MTERSKARDYGRSLAGIAGFECRWGHVCLSLVSVVHFQVKVSVRGRSLVQRSPTGCGVSLCVNYKPRARGGPGPRWAVAAGKKKSKEMLHVLYSLQHVSAYILAIVM